MIKGSVTLVTGGASGLGRGTVQLLVENGGFAVIADLPSSNGKLVAEQLGEDKCTFIAADVSVEKDVQNIISTIKNKYGKLDNVVNCAGVPGRQQIYNLETKTVQSLETFSHILNVNTVGTFNVIRLAVGLMCENKKNEDGQRGVIINTSSIRAFEGRKGNVAYSASKAAVAGMTLPLARELAQYGIRVCAISPGFFETAMTSIHDSAVRSSIINNTAFPKRSGHPSEFAKLVHTIIENPMLNGEVIRLDAGLRDN